ncbi:MAG TPA: T9SS type A sorting domain-containing protein [Bacteroidia bacterium]|jgi:hypothetical protein|nr:T9SS type A sorting domain-containing protein [Bacteroidia bacterium]
MKKAIGYTLVFLFTLLCNSGIAQVIVFSPHHILGFQNSVAQGAVVTDSVTVKDSSASAAFTAPLTFHCAILDSSTHLLVATNDTTTYSTINIAAGHTQTFLLHRTYGTNNTAPPGPYKTGINVIVIWPSCANPSAIIKGDTLQDTVYIASVAGIAPLNVYNLFSMYPNPSRGTLCIEGDLPAGKEVEQVIIYTDKGQPCATYSKQYKLDLSTLSKGYYMVEVLFRDGSRGRRKLILQ